MRKFALELHPDKTRLVRFGRTAKRGSKVERDRAGTFDFLGFTHICGESRAGKLLLVRRTMRKGMQAKLKDIRGLRVLCDDVVTDIEQHANDCRSCRRAPRVGPSGGGGTAICHAAHADIVVQEDARRFG